MARPNNEFLLAWDSLSGDDLSVGWRSISLQHSGPLEIRAGRRSPDNAEAVLIGFPTAHFSKAEKLPEGNGFSVELTDFIDADRMWLALSRKFAGSVDLFAAMSCDVIGALDDAVVTGSSEQQLAILCIRRIAAWQEFMRKGADGLSPEEEVGLAGELTFLQFLIDSGVVANDALESWVGPVDGIQDFEIGTGAVEVKTTLSTNGFSAKVGSLEQLDDSVRQPLFLAAMRFTQNLSGANLPEIVTSLRERFEGDPVSINLFSERLLAAGYTATHATRYVRKLAISQMKLLMVGDGFPRLTPGTVPLGIRRAMYEIDIDKVPGEDFELTQALMKLGV
jgi:hypothetical protein